MFERAVPLNASNYMLPIKVRFNENVQIDILTFGQRENGKKEK